MADPLISFGLAKDWIQKLLGLWSEVLRDRRTELEEVLPGGDRTVVRGQGREAGERARLSVAGAQDDRYHQGLA